MAGLLIHADATGERQRQSLLGPSQGPSSAGPATLRQQGGYARLNTANDLAWNRDLP